MKKVLIAAFLTVCPLLSQVNAHYAIESPLSTIEAPEQDNPRGLVTRKGVKYKWELLKTQKDSKYQIKIVREQGGKSNLVFFTDVIVMSEAGGYTVKMFASKENGYKWDIDRETYFKITYGSSGKRTLEEAGKIATFKDPKLGMTEAQLETQTALNTKFSNAVIRHVQSATEYMIFKYPKMMKNH